MSFVALSLAVTPLQGVLIVVPIISTGKSYEKVIDFSGSWLPFVLLVRLGLWRGGDTRFILINDIISIWGIVLPVSYLAAFVFGWPPAAVVICLNADQVFKCLAVGIRANSFRWVKKLTRAEEAS